MPLSSFLTALAGLCRTGLCRTCRPASILLACVAALAATAQAQVAGPGAPTIEPYKVAPPATAGAAINGYAESLRPTVRRPAAVAQQPYEPIRAQSDQAHIPEIEMFVGESRVFPAPGVARIAVGNGALMTAAALDGREVIVFANGVGTSSLFIWNEDGCYQRVKVNIVPGDTSRFAREIAAFLTAIPSARASVIGDKVIVEGEHLSDHDLARIAQLAKIYPQIVNFTNPVGWDQMVLIDVKVVEFPVNLLREIGLRWTSVGGSAIGAIWAPIRRGRDGPYQIGIQTGQGQVPPISSPDAESGVILPRGLNVLSAVNLGLNAQLDLLEQQGQTTVLASPQLSTRNGSQAQFLAGGEYPYVVSTTNGPSVLFRPYGVRLNITPQVDRHGTIRADVYTELSQIDPSVSTIAGPGLLTRSTQATFNVRSGETVVLSGLIQRESSQAVDKVPLLGDIPILGALFRSKRFQNRETELVIFLTPTVVDSRTPALVDRVERIEERLRDRLSEVPHLSDPLQPGRDPGRPAAPLPEEGSVPRPARDVTRDPGAPAASAPAPGHGSIPSTLGSALRVTQDGLAVRAEPEADSPALLHLGRGAVVVMGSADPQPPGSGIWRQVAVGELMGWAAARGLEPLPAALRPEAAGLAVPPGPYADRDRQGRVVAVAPAGTAASQAARGRTPADAELQWPAGPASPPGDGATVHRPAPYRVLLDRLALRVTPDINAPVIAHLAAGEAVTALPYPAQGAWLAIQAGPRTGWVAAQWLLPAHLWP